MPYTRLLSRDAEEAAEYKVLFDAAVDVPRQYFPQYSANHLTLFGSEATGVFLTETFTSGIFNRNGSDLSLTDLEQVSRGIPCQSTRR